MEEASQDASGEPISPGHLPAHTAHYEIYSSSVPFAVAIVSGKSVTNETMETNGGEF
jgi:hypothetical protein